MSVVIVGFLFTFLGGSLLCQVQSKLATVIVEVTDPIFRHVQYAAAAYIIDLCEIVVAFAKGFLIHP